MKRIPKGVVETNLSFHIKSYRIFSASKRDHKNKMFYIELPLVCPEKKLFQRNTFKSSTEEKWKMVYIIQALSTCNRPYTYLLSASKHDIRCCKLLVLEKKNCYFRIIFNSMCNGTNGKFFSHLFSWKLLLSSHNFGRKAFIFCCLNFQENFENILSRHCS